MSIRELVIKTVELNQRFRGHFGKQGRALSLMSEVGELADAMLEYEGGKEKGTRDPKGKEHVADALADILYNIFLIANHYDVDLDEEYERVLNGVENRLKKGEFVEKKEI
jgi:NTP pyrophosphatase (non-canonical NTP hydrolase)